jgi:lauroyl/myristoyl acyltransferase
VINAFGMKMCVSLLHAVLVQRGPARLVPVEGRSEPDGSCRVIIHEPLVLPADASLQQITQACWDFFEPAIRAQPEDWMWNYPHWRYKPADAERAYPFYSCANGEFDRLIYDKMVKT